VLETVLLPLVVVGIEFKDRFMSSIPLVPLKVLIVDRDESAARALLDILKGIDSVVHIRTTDSLEIAQSLIRQHDINAIYIDLISTGLDAATQFIFGIREAYPTLVFVLYYDSTHRQARDGGLFDGPRHRLIHYYKLDKTHGQDFSAKVASTVYQCQSYLVARLARDTIDLLKSEVTSLTSPTRQESTTPDVSMALLERLDEFLNRTSLMERRLQNAEFLGPPAGQKSQPSVFLIMPYSESWSHAVEELLHEVCEQRGFHVQIARAMDGRFVPQDIWRGINEASVVIADLTGANPNVSYEIGLADAIGRQVVLLCQNTAVPFDFLAQRLILYKDTVAGAKQLKKQLGERLENLQRGTDLA
jgi:DNA-binding NarL/FixJ family response regulator